MIKVTRFSGEILVVNADLIEVVEATPDTVVTLTTGRKLVVQESVDMIVQAVVDYKRACFYNPLGQSLEECEQQDK